MHNLNLIIRNFQTIQKEISNLPDTKAIKVKDIRSGVILKETDRTGWLNTECFYTRCSFYTMPHSILLGQMVTLLKKILFLIMREVPVGLCVSMVLAEGRREL